MDRGEPRRRAGPARAGGPRGPVGALVAATLLEDRASEAGDEVAVRRARLVQGDVHGRQGRAAAGARTLREINRWAAEHDQPWLLARSHRLLSTFFTRAGHRAMALEHAVRCVEHLPVDVSPSLSPSQRADHLLALGDALAECGSVEEACQRYAAPGELATQAGNARLRLVVLNNLAFVQYEAGLADDALTTVEHMRSLAGAWGSRLEVSYLDTIARMHVLRGDYAKAEQTPPPPRGRPGSIPGSPTAHGPSAGSG